MKRLVLLFGIIIIICSCNNKCERRQQDFVDSMVNRINMNQKIIDSLINVVDERNQEIIKRNYELIKRQDQLIKERLNNKK
jgi:hypothetical protein